MIKKDKVPKMSMQKIEDAVENYNRIVVSTEVTVSIDSHSILFDFKTKFPQGDRIIIEHSPIAVDIFLGKKFANLLNNAVSAFEQKFGKIDEPEFMKTFEKEKSRATERIEKQKPDADRSYVG